jgi:hypothetical protein
MQRIGAILLSALLTLCLTQLSAQSQGKKKSRGSDPALSKSYLSQAVYYSTDLKLSERQMDSLRFHTKKASAMKKKMTAYQVGLYERRVLKRFLSEGQYEDLFGYKNLAEARLLGENSWNEMLSLNYVDEADSAKLYLLVWTHIHTVLVAKDYWGDNPGLLERYLIEIDMNSPACLYRYFHHGERKPPANDYYRSDFLY